MREFSTLQTAELFQHFGGGVLNTQFVALCAKYDVGIYPISKITNRAENLQGFSEGKDIFIPSMNSKKNAFIALHELAHVVLHYGRVDFQEYRQNLVCRTKIEVEADNWANEHLLSIGYKRRINKKELEESWVWLVCYMYMNCEECINEFGESKYHYENYTFVICPTFKEVWLYDDNLNTTLLHKSVREFGLYLASVRCQTAKS